VTTTPLPVAITASTGGTIKLDDGGVCPPTCTQTQNSGARHTYEAVPNAAPFRFQAWGGGCGNQGNPCTTVAAPGLAVSGQFAEFYTVSVRVSGTGTVTAFCPVGCTLVCTSGTCSTDLPKGSYITLTAMPKSPAKLMAW